MDTGQSDFTDPPSPRQICYRILGRDIEDPPCEEGGGGTRRRGGGLAKTYPTGHGFSTTGGLRYERGAIYY